MKHDLFSANELTKYFEIDAKTLNKWLSRHQIEPVETESNARDIRKYYRLKQFWPFLSEYSSETEVSGGIHTKTKEQIDKEIAFEKARKDKRENDEAEGLVAPIDEVVKLGSPIMEEAEKILERLGEECRSICPSLDENDVDRINEKLGVRVKNTLAAVVDKIQKQFSPDMEEAAIDTQD